MKIEDLAELHFIAPIESLPSIFRVGILSHDRAKRVEHNSIAKPGVQDRRARTRVPNGRWLHEYANLYLNARNPMMYLRKNQHRELAVVRVATDVLTLPDVVITDRNAARDWPRWETSPDGLSMIDYGRVFAEYWTHPGDDAEKYRHAGEMCAEVLVPDVVRPDHLIGAYVSCGASATVARALVPKRRITVNGYLFFFTARGGIR